MKNSYVILFCFFFISGFSQVQPPPFLKWQKITTPHFKIVFPEGLESEARETASLMNFMYSRVPDVYRKKTRRINLYLNNQTTVANGFVTLAPRYMEWYMNPPQEASTGGTDWKRLLAIHEYRHVVQFDNFNDHVTKLFSYAFGDYALGLLLNWSVPAWYMEGDAVSAETVLSNTGRGRLPWFEMETKAIFTGTGRKVTYDQAYLGSYKNYFPNHYHLGYLMHTHVARNYSMNAWFRIMNRVNKMPYLPWSFSSAMKKYAGFNVKNTYLNTFSELKDHWLIYPLPAEVEQVMNTQNKVRTNYRYGNLIKDSTIIFLKYGMADAPQIVRLDMNGKEEIIAFLNNTDFISYNAGIIAWNTQTSDIRWGERSFSDIVVYHLDTKRMKTITRRKKYVSPAVSPSGKNIAVVRYGEDLRYYIDILDVETGNLLKEFDFGKTYVRTPSWSPDEKQLVFTTSSEEGITLSLINTDDGKITELIRSESENMTKPVFMDHYVLFNSPLTGLDAIHAVDLLNGKRYLALTGGYGFFNPSVSEVSGILVEGYIPNEYRLFKWIPDEKKFIPFEPSMVNDSFYISPVIDRGNYHNVFNDYKPDTSFKIQKYHHLFDGLKFHSWVPNLALPNLIGGQVYAADPLSQISLSLNLEYNINENNTFESVILRYAGLYPVFDVSFGTGNRNATYVYTIDSSEMYQWRENSFSLQTTLPFNLSKGAFYQNIELTGGYSYVHKKDIDERFINEFDYGEGTLSTANVSFRYFGYRQLSYRDFYPQIGALIMAGYEKTLAGSDFNGSIRYGSLTGFLPGMFRHHSLKLTLSYEEQDPSFGNGYIFPSQMLYFRGYEHYFYNRFFKFSADYSLPVIYPDLAIGPVLYIKRIRTNLFTDFGEGYFQSTGTDFLSYGLDILFDCNFFRLLNTIDLGPRFAFTRSGDWEVSFVFLQALNL